MPAPKIPARSATRYEMKAVLDEIDLPTVQNWLWLHDACFHVRFQQRLVNSLYYDTPGLDSFNDNLFGSSQRHKVRLRWYGLDLEEVQTIFEVKHKHNRYGWKLSQKIAQPLSFERLTWRELLDVLQRELAHELQGYLSQGCEQILLVRYQREYYETFDGRIRVTVDHHMEAFDQRHNNQLNLRYPLSLSNALVVECKANQENSAALASVLSTAPFRITRSSKYADAVVELLDHGAW